MVFDVHSDYKALKSGLEDLWVAIKMIVLAAYHWMIIPAHLR